MKHEFGWWSAALWIKPKCSQLDSLGVGRNSSSGMEFAPVRSFWFSFTLIISLSWCLIFFYSLILSLSAVALYAHAHLNKFPVLLACLSSCGWRACLLPNSSVWNLFAVLNLCWLLNWLIPFQTNINGTSTAIIANQKRIERK